MDEHLSLGSLGEDIAAKHLRRKGYRIVERNCRRKWGELDIVAVGPDKMLVLIEVKTVSSPTPKITGEDQMTTQKTRRFKRAAQMYANGDGKSLVGEGGWRMDLITIESSKSEATIRHYQNI